MTQLEILTVVVAVSVALYFGITWFVMGWTFNFKHTVNHFIFHRSLRKEELDYLHYIERTLVIIFGVGLFSTIISLIQILVQKRKDKLEKDEQRAF